VRLGQNRARRNDPVSRNRLLTAGKVVGGVAVFLALVTVGHPAAWGYLLGANFACV